MEGLVWIPRPLIIRTRVPSVPPPQFSCTVHDVLDMATAYHTQTQHTYLTLKDQLVLIWGLLKPTKKKQGAKKLAVDA